MIGGIFKNVKVKSITCALFFKYMLYEWQYNDVFKAEMRQIYGIYKALTLRNEAVLVENNGQSCIPSNTTVLAKNYFIKINWHSVNKINCCPMVLIAYIEKLCNSI